MTETRNAVIRSVSLGFESHRIFTAYVNLDFGGLLQSFGGYFMKGAWGIEFLKRVLETVGEDEWEKLPGRPIRVRGNHSSIDAIGHFIEDKWFEPRVDLKHLEGKS